jgi:hypothetical protein
MLSPTNVATPKVTATTTACTPRGSPVNLRPMQASYPASEAGTRDDRLRVDLVQRNHDIGAVRARTATLYAPLRVVPQKGREA